MCAPARWLIPFAEFHLSQVAGFRPFTACVVGCSWVVHTLQTNISPTEKTCAVGFFTIDLKIFMVCTSPQTDVKAPERTEMEDVVPIDRGLLGE